MRTSDSSLHDRVALVTGANGFLGRVLVARLLAEGARVRALVLPGESVPDTWGAVDVVRGDVTFTDDVARAFGDATLVFHLAAIVGDAGDDALHQRVTVGGTRVVAERAATHRARLVLASSIVTYGDRIGRARCDERTPHGRAMGPYSRAKQGQERVVHALADARGLDVVIVRPGNVYGPGSGPWLHDVTDVLRRGQPCLIGGGDFDAGLAYVDDVVDVMVRGATRATSRDVLLAVDESGVTWRRYFTDLARIVDARPPRSAPRLLMRALAPIIETTWSRLGIRGRPPLTREAVNLVGMPNLFDASWTRARLGIDGHTPYEDALAATARYVNERRPR